MTEPTDLPDDEFLSADERAQALDPTTGAGTPDSAPWEQTATSWFRRQPIVATLVSANVPLLVGLAGSLSEDAPWWISALIGAGVALANGIGAAAHRSVTPLVRPRDIRGNVLTP